MYHAHFFGVDADADADAGMSERIEMPAGAGG